MQLTDDGQFNSMLTPDKVKQATKSRPKSWFLEKDFGLNLNLESLQLSVKNGSVQSTKTSLLLLFEAQSFPIPFRHCYMHI